MATCKCCDKKLGLLVGSNKLSDEYDEPMCDGCFYKFKTQLNIVEQSKDKYCLEINYENAVATIKKCNFSEDSTNYILSFAESLKQTVLDKLQQDIVNKTEEALRVEKEVEQKLQFKRLMDNHLMTTGYYFDGYRIKGYNGVISGSVVLGTGFLSEFGASISDLFGSQSELFSDKLETARELALKNLVKKSAQNSGNAIIGIDFDYITFSNNMIGVVANGTSVVVEQIEQEEG